MPQQIDLFCDYERAEKQEKLDGCVEKLRQRFGIPLEELKCFNEIGFTGCIGINLCFVRPLDRRVFLLDLMDFAVNAGGESVTDLADGFVCLELQLALAPVSYTHLERMEIST